MTRVRLMALAAATLFLVSLPFPYWSARMSAPTYPEGDLSLHMYAVRYDGDIDEWARVGKLVGVEFPPPIPEIFFRLFPAAIILTTLVALGAAARSRWLTIASLLPWVVMAGLAAWGQYNLYLFGHNLDPDRPLKVLEPFTPPLIGIVTLGKIRVYHYPDISALLFLAGAVLLVLSALHAGRFIVPLRRKGLAARA